ncbi:MAG: lipopolysaccharide biosynthesis protein [Kiloniellaceae bacterium]
MNRQQIGPRVFAWLRSTILLRHFRNAGVLLMGKGTGAIFSLVYLGLAVRTLGPEAFGVLVLLHTLVHTAGELAKFQSWQAIMRYGALALAGSRVADLQRLVKFTLLLDLAGAAAGIGIALLCIGPALRFLNIPAEAEPLAMAYSAVIFFMSPAMPNGFLRLFDRFDLIAAQNVVGPAIRLLGALALWAAGAGLPAFLALWFLSTAASAITLMVLALRELHRQGMLRDMPLTLRGLAAPHKFIWSFVWSTNLNTTLNLASDRVGTLAVGWLLGPDAAGLYRIAHHVTDAIRKPASKLLTPTIYPELARLSATGESAAAHNIVARSAILAGAATAGAFGLVVLFGQPLLHYAFGPEFVAAYEVMVLMALAGVIATVAFPLEPLLVSAGRMRAVITARTTATVLYILLLYLTLQQFGIVGAGIAAIAYTGATAGLLLAFSGRIQGAGISST